MTVPKPPEVSPIARLAAGFSIGCLALVAVLLTNDQYGFAIDEATYFWVADEARAWFARLPTLGREAFSKAEIAKHFHFLEPPGANGPGQHSNLNLPVSHHLINLGYIVSAPFATEPLRYRWSSALVFALTVWATFDLLLKRRGWLAGSAAALALLLSPRIFGHAHLAATETPMASLWLLSLLCIVRHGSDTERFPSFRQTFLASLVIALTLGTKLTAWLMVPAALLGLIAYRPLGWRRLLLTSALMTVLLLYVLTPPLWHDPVDTLARHLQTVLNNPWKIMTFYLGRGYLDDLPWTSAPVTLLTTEPVSWLFLSFIGTLAVRRDRLAALLSLNFVVLFGARLLSLIPTHDGERQFLPCYYFLACLAGIGIDELRCWASSRFPRLQQRAGGMARGVGYLLLAALLLEPLTETWRYRGHGLMYYNQLVGGLRGASEHGFEVSYWFEAATDEVWREFLKDLPPGSRIFLRPDHPGLMRLQERGVWRKDLVAAGPEEADFYLLYAKRAAYCLPSDDGPPVVTGLLAAQMNAPATKELWFDGVRILALIPVRRSQN